jgi:hypothetical protein
MPPTEYEARGVTCLECKGMRTKERPDLAEIGIGACHLRTPVVFVSIEMARNCWEFIPATPEKVAIRRAWINSLPDRWPQREKES